MPTSRVGNLELVWEVAGPPDGPPVLMINGLGAARAGWGLQVPALAERYRVFTFDNRDVGETGNGRNPGDYAMSQFAIDAIGLVESLELGPVHVIGASMGGTIAQEMVLLRPDLVQSVQIVCSWARTDAWLAELVQQWSEMFAAMGNLAWARNSWLWVFTHRWFNDPENVASQIAAVQADPYPQTAEMFGRQCAAILPFDALDRLGEISTPAHVIAGAEDLLTPPRYSEEIVAAIPEARLTIMPEVGHGMFWEATDAFNSALLRFLNEQHD